jgi:hypothetical protein
MYCMYESTLFTTCLSLLSVGSTFFSYDDCKYGLKPNFLVVYSNNTCFQSYKGTFESNYNYSSVTGICLSEGSSYSTHAVASSTSGSCIGSSKFTHKYTITQEGPGCYRGWYDSLWYMGNTNQCGSTLPTDGGAPSLQPTVPVVQRPPSTASSFQPVSTYSSQPNPQPSTAYSSYPAVRRFEDSVTNHLGRAAASCWPSEAHHR